MARYSFSVPSFHIGEIRSAHTDTLFASTALKVMNARGGLHHDYGSKGVSLGDRKAGGDVVPNLSGDLIWEDVDVPDPTPEDPDGGAVYWTFILVNGGHQDSGFVTALNKAADAWAGALAGKSLDAKEAGSAILLVLASVGIIVAQEVLNLLTADCDGGVASGAFDKTAAELSVMSRAPNQPFRTTQPNPGTDSPAGCGSNSSYDVTYQIQRLPEIVPTVVIAEPIG